MTQTPPSFRPPRTTQKTYWHLLAAAKVPSEYELLTSRLDYRSSHPLGIETPSARFMRESAREPSLRMTDWERFADPSAHTYMSYVQSKQSQDAFLETLANQDAAAGHRLSERALTLWTSVVAPLRFALHGLQMLASYLGAAAPAGRIAVVAAFQAADEMHRVHRLTQRMYAVGESTNELGRDSRARFEREPAWQPVRRAIERMLVVYDWSTAFCGVNILLKPVLDLAFFNAGAEIARNSGEETLARMLASFAVDGQRQRDWTRSLVLALCEESAANRQVLQLRTREVAPLVDDVAQTFGSRFWPEEVDGGLFTKQLRTRQDEWLAQIGVARGQQAAVAEREVRE